MRTASRPARRRKVSPSGMKGTIVILKTAFFRNQGVLGVTNTLEREFRSEESLMVESFDINLDDS